MPRNVTPSAPSAARIERAEIILVGGAGAALSRLEIDQHVDSRPTSRGAIDRREIGGMIDHDAQSVRRRGVERDESGDLGRRHVRRGDVYAREPRRHHHLGLAQSRAADAERTGFDLAARDGD